MITELQRENDDLIHNEMMQWSYKKLLSLGYTLKSNTPENVLKTPWSYVARFETIDCLIYLKHTPEQIALEAPIIQILHDQFEANVPEIIAHNTDLNCFLMKDAGQSLRSILKKKFDLELVLKTIDQFTSLQVATANQVDVFLNMGVPDYRLDKLPDLYMNLLFQKELLIADGLSENEIKELEKLRPFIFNVCKKLSAYAIKESIVQPDFNDNNTLFDDKSQNLTIIDLGEIVISHPFFSLLNFLQQMKKHHGMTDEDETYLQIQDACFKNYLVYGSKKQLLDAFEISHILSSVYGALANYRLMMACGIEKIMSFQRGRLSGSLKELMDAL